MLKSFNNINNIYTFDVHVSVTPGYEDKFQEQEVMITVWYQVNHTEEVIISGTVNAPNVEVDLEIPETIFNINVDKKTDIGAYLEVHSIYTDFTICPLPIKELTGSSEDSVYFRLDQNLQYIEILNKTGAILNRDRKSTRLNSSHTDISRMPSSA